MPRRDVLVSNAAGRLPEPARPRAARGPRRRQPYGAHLPHGPRPGPTRHQGQGDRLRAPLRDLEARGRHDRRPRQDQPRHVDRGRGRSGGRADLEREPDGRRLPRQHRVLEPGAPAPPVEALGRAPSDAGGRDGRVEGPPSAGQAAAGNQPVAGLARQLEQPAVIRIDQRRRSRQGAHDRRHASRQVPGAGGGPHLPPRAQLRGADDDRPHHRHARAAAGAREHEAEARPARRARGREGRAGRDPRLGRRLRHDRLRGQGAARRRRVGRLLRRRPEGRRRALSEGRLEAGAQRRRLAPPGVRDARGVRPQDPVAARATAGRRSKP